MNYALLYKGLLDWSDTSDALIAMKIILNVALTNCNLVSPWSYTIALTPTFYDVHCKVCSDSVYGKNPNCYATSICIILF